MIQLLVGREGAGKTKTLVDRANALAKDTDGHICYVDLDASHIYRLDYSIRFVDTNEYPLETSAEFLGFICGIISQDYDLKTMFIDGLLKNAKATPDQSGVLLEKLESVSEKYDLNFVISMCCDPSDIPEKYHKYFI